jgi:hypothetical protein
LAITSPNSTARPGEKCWPSSRSDLILLKPDGKELKTKITRRERPPQ